MFPISFLVNIDLFDGSGSVCQLEGNLNDNASKFTKEREKYVLVKKESMFCLLFSFLRILPYLKTIVLADKQPCNNDSVVYIKQSTSIY